MSVLVNLALQYKTVYHFQPPVSSFNSTSPKVRVTLFTCDGTIHDVSLLLSDASGRNRRLYYMVYTFVDNDGRRRSSVDYYEPEDRATTARKRKLRKKKIDQLLAAVEPPAGRENTHRP